MRRPRGGALSACDYVASGEADDHLVGKCQLTLS